ncbi:MAG: mechanosensitive ion channel [Nocardioides sp.]|nr:mechanosensitive ion channel [Nocardioides sp.]
MKLDDFDWPGIITQVVGAAVILLVTWILAKVVKRVITVGLGKVKFFERQAGSGEGLAASLGTIGSLVVWLFGLIAVLNLFKLTAAVAPIQDLLSSVLAALPGVIGAGLIFFVGLVLARIVRELVEVALQTAGADSWLSGSGDRVSTDSSSEASAGSDVKISQLAGQLVFVVVLVGVSISALQVLGIRAISEPATAMLELILNTIPSILAAAILLGIGYLIARVVAPILESTLRGLGTDRVLAEIGVAREGTSASGIAARVVQIAIMLFFAVAATRALGFPEITNILDTVLAIGGRVLFGAAIIAAGVLIANILSRMVSGQASQILKYATMALFVAIGLQFMGLADSIITLAFGSVVVGGALAAALAFGLGGRDAAARQLEQLQARQATTGRAGESTDGGAHR